MKKLIFILLLIFLPLSLSAQLRHIGYQIQEEDSTGKAYWQIKGIESDTSGWHRSQPYMTLYYWMADTTGNDSVDVDMYLQITNTGRDIPVTKKTKAVAVDSVNSDWILTDTAIGNGAYWRIIITGGADNTNLAGSLFKIFYDGYEEAIK